MEAYKNNDELVYTFRVKLLLESGFKLTYATPNEVHLNAESNIDSCLRMMCQQNLYSSKVTRKCKCGETSRNLTTIEMNMKDLVSAGIRILDSCLVLGKHNDRSTTCKICKKTIKTVTDLASLAFIDIGSVTTRDDFYKLPDLPLTAIPKIIQIHSKIYELRGVIEYIPDIAHYTVHCIDKGVFYEYNDLSEDIKASNKNPIKPNILIFGMCRILTFWQFSEFSLFH